MLHQLQEGQGHQNQVSYLPFRWPQWLCKMRVKLVIKMLQVWPQSGQQRSFVEIDHEVFSTVILSLPLIQEGHLSVSGKRMCTVLVNLIED